MVPSPSLHKGRKKISFRLSVQSAFLKTGSPCPLIFPVSRREHKGKAPLAEGLVDENENLLDEVELQPPLQAMSKGTAHILQRFLTQTVEVGSGKHAKPEGGTAAGKTATAQSGWYDASGVETLHTWFAGYFPADDPQYAIVVLKEDGSSGATDGAPVFKEIAEDIMRGAGRTE